MSILKIFQKIIFLKFTIQNLRSSCRKQKLGSYAALLLFVTMKF